MKKIISALLTICIVLGGFAFNAYAGPYPEDPVMDKVYDVYSRAISKWGRENFFGYCGACVGYQLLSYGINSSYVGLNGNQTYAYYSSKAKTSGGYCVKTYPASGYSLAQVINHLNSDSSSEASFPLLIGYNKGTASAAGQTYGHTMLVYEVYGGYVYYADSTLTKWQDNIHKTSINDFLWLYSDKSDTNEREFVFDGAVQFYKRAPLAANVRVSNNKLSLWQPVDFYVSAPGSTGYVIGIDRDGQRITNIIPGVGGYSTLQFGEPGVYTAYVTSWNLYGSVDSQAVTFEVVSTPVNPYINVESSSVYYSSPVNISFGANNANAYCIGVSYPNGDYSVYYTDDSTYSIPTTQKGTYTVFVTCCNSYGYVDTQSVSVNVY